jgi:hypothetical protein
MTIHGTFTLFKEEPEHCFTDQRFFEPRMNRGNLMAQSPVLRERSKSNQETGTDSAALNKVWL